MIIQLATEVIDYALALWTKNKNEAAQPGFHFEEFQPAWILVLAILWLSFRQTVQNFSMNPGRVVGLVHAVSTCLMGLPILVLLCSTSGSYQDMLQSFLDHAISVRVTANVVCYSSVGYFVMDSFFLVRKAYLKHHIGAIFCFLLAAYHHETSLVHAVCTVTLFELGAVLVQASRAFPNVVFRTMICVGYTMTRLALVWYYGFIYTTCYYYWDGVSVAQFTIFPIYAGLLFLLALNFKWCFLQWKALVQVIRTRTAGADFYALHQKIIGASS